MSKNKTVVLSNGLCVLSAKIKTKNLVSLALTNFNKTNRFIFDIQENKFIPPNLSDKFDLSDLNLIKKYVESAINVK